MSLRNKASFWTVNGIVDIVPGDDDGETHDILVDFFIGSFQKRKVFAGVTRFDEVGVWGENFSFIFSG